MSHGPGDKCEPNLIPLLDLVLQLVMFFMVCANFVMEQVNESIKLPEAISAKPLDKRDEYIIFLNVNSKGQVVLSNLDEPDDSKRLLTNPAQIRNYMKRRAEEDYRATGDRSKAPRSTLILRVDKEAPFVRPDGTDDLGVWDVMKACRAAGYERVQLRAIRFGGQVAPQ